MTEETRVPTREHVVTKWHQYDNYLCEKCGYASLDPDAFDKHSCIGEVDFGEPPATDEDEVVEIAEALGFASKAASDLAHEHELTVEDFREAGVTTSDRGFTIEHVRTVLAHKEE